MDKSELLQPILSQIIDFIQKSKGFTHRQFLVTKKCVKYYTPINLQSAFAQGRLKIAHKFKAHE